MTQSRYAYVSTSRATTDAARSPTRTTVLSPGAMKASIGPWAFCCVESCG